jgi:hypothetical protein
MSTSSGCAAAFVRKATRNPRLAIPRHSVVRVRALRAAVRHLSAASAAGGAASCAPTSGGHRSTRRRSAPCCRIPRRHGPMGASSDRQSEAVSRRIVCAYSTARLLPQPGRRARARHRRHGALPAARPRRCLRLLPGLRRSREGLVVLRLLAGRADLRTWRRCCPAEPGERACAARNSARCETSSRRRSADARFSK